MLRPLAALLGAFALFACTGGPGPIPAYDDPNYDSITGSREPSGSGREVPPIGQSERPPNNDERPPLGQLEPAPGKRIGGGGGAAGSVAVAQTFTCSGSYTCVSSADGQQSNVNLSRNSDGKCRTSGFTLEDNGTITASSGQQTVVVGTWAASGNGVTVVLGQETRTCTPRS